MIPCLLTYPNHGIIVILLKPLHFDCSQSVRYNCFLVDFLDCHATLTQSHGDITSFGFPQGYYNNMDCTWLIQRPNGEVIEIRFTSFDVESDFTYFVCM